MTRYQNNPDEDVDIKELAGKIIMIRLEEIQTIFKSKIKKQYIEQIRKIAIMEHATNNDIMVDSGYISAGARTIAQMTEEIYHIFNYNHYENSKKIVDELIRCTIIEQNKKKPIIEQMEQLRQLIIDHINTCSISNRNNTTTDWTDSPINIRTVVSCSSPFTPITTSINQNIENKNIEQTPQDQRKASAHNHVPTNNLDKSDINKSNDKINYNHNDNNHSNSNSNRNTNNENNHLNKSTDNNSPDIIEINTNKLERPSMAPSKSILKTKEQPKSDSKKNNVNSTTEKNHGNNGRTNNHHSGNRPFQTGKGEQYHNNLSEPIKLYIGRIYTMDFWEVIRLIKDDYGIPIIESKEISKESSKYLSMELTILKSNLETLKIINWPRETIIKIFNTNEQVELKGRHRYTNEAQRGSSTNGQYNQNRYNQSGASRNDRRDNGFKPETNHRRSRSRGYYREQRYPKHYDNN